jgi:arabinogalactan endo-1,4-beta-galactosidase
MLRNYRMQRIGQWHYRGGVTDFDILGLSHYPKWSTVSTMAEIENKIRTFKSAYGKQVMVVETAYPWTGDNADSYN